MNDNMTEVYPGFSAGVPLAKEIFNNLGDARYGAVVINHKGGDAVIYMNLYKFGSLNKHIVPRNSLLRYLFVMFYPKWQYQARYKSAGCASGAFTKTATIYQAKKEIERMKKEYEQRTHRIR